MPCLKDSNRKTNLYALEVLLKILPTLSPHISSNVVGFIVPTIVGNLASAHREIHDAAANVLDLFIEVLGAFCRSFNLFYIFLFLHLESFHTVETSQFRPCEKQTSQ